MWEGRGKVARGGAVATRPLDVPPDSPNVAGAEWAVTNGFFEAGHPCFHYLTQQSAVT